MKITQFDFRTAGKEMGERHILGTTADAPWLQFPADFCLEPLINDTCQAPAGVSAVVYDTNPLGSLPTSPRLSLDTKIVEASVSNRDNALIDVSKVYEDQQGGIQLYLPRTNRTRAGLPSKSKFGPIMCADDFDLNSVRSTPFPRISCHQLTGTPAPYCPQSFLVSFDILNWSDINKNVNHE